MTVTMKNGQNEFSYVCLCSWYILVLDNNRTAHNRHGKGKFQSKFEISSTDSLMWSQIAQFLFHGMALEAEVRA